MRLYVVRPCRDGLVYACQSFYDPFRPCIVLTGGFDVFRDLLFLFVSRLPLRFGNNCVRLRIHQILSAFPKPVFRLRPECADRFPLYL